MSNFIYLILSILYGRIGIHDRVKKTGIFFIILE